MERLPVIGRRRVLGLGLGVAAVTVFGPRRLAGAWNGSPVPTAEIGSTNLVVNPSFEDGPPGPTAPGWTFR